MSLEKEDCESITKEMKRLDKEIDKLNGYKFILPNKKVVLVKYEIYKTMFDGKCVNSLVDNQATSRRPMCLKTAHQFGNSSIDFTPKESSLSFGLSLLHAEIKAFKHLLHLSYRLELDPPGWDVHKFKERKFKIQRVLYERFGIKVDLCLQGHGTTNTGNLARRCFIDPKLFDTCLELDSKLVENLAYIILCFKSKQTLDLDKLEKFCHETYWYHYEKYKWSRMNPSTHKLLMHGCQISRKFPLPIQYFSEDSSEAWHKLNRRNFNNGSRQTSHANRILDVFNKAIYLSDPKISMVHLQNRLKFHRTKDYPDEVVDFFVRNTPKNTDDSEKQTTKDRDEDNSSETSDCDEVETMISAIAEQSRNNATELAEVKESLASMKERHTALC
uniref:Uncharacterized protein n=1 Tax=Trichogramma kaykai TaxID=54128 RepID=A0ABD2W9W8_9HYME